MVGNVGRGSVPSGVLARPQWTKREGSVDTFTEMEKKGGEELGVVSTLISSVNGWNVPRRLAGEEGVGDASTLVGSVSVSDRPRRFFIAEQPVPSCVCCVMIVSFDASVPGEALCTLRTRVDRPFVR